MGLAGGVLFLAGAAEGGVAREVARGFFEGADDLVVLGVVLIGGGVLGWF